jgi:hypothetical protein
MTASFRFNESWFVKATMPNQGAHEPPPSLKVLDELWRLGAGFAAGVDPQRRAVILFVRRPVWS